MTTNEQTPENGIEPKSAIPAIFARYKEETLWMIRLFDGEHLKYLMHPSSKADYEKSLVRNNDLIREVMETESMMAASATGLQPFPYLQAAVCLEKIEVEVQGSIDMIRGSRHNLKHSQRTSLQLYSVLSDLTGIRKDMTGLAAAALQAAPEALENNEDDEPADAPGM